MICLFSSFSGIVFAKIQLLMTARGLKMGEIFGIPIFRMVKALHL